MKTNICTSVIALLLFASFSCKKDAADTTAVSGNSTDRTSETAGTSLAPETRLISPVGDWMLYYDWYCDGYYDSVSMSIKPNGTWKDGSGKTGKWDDSRGLFMFIFDGPGRTTYTGTERLEKIVGFMSVFGGGEGCFSLEKTNGKNIEASHTPGKPDAAGNVQPKN